LKCLFPTTFYQTIYQLFAGGCGIFPFLYLFPPLVLIEYRFEFEGNFRINHGKIERDGVMTNKYLGEGLVPSHKKQSMDMSPILHLGDI
jgi:hypothetical protein